MKDPITKDCFAAGFKAGAIVSGAVGTALLLILLIFI